MSLGHFGRRFSKNLYAFEEIYRVLRKTQVLVSAEISTPDLAIENIDVFSKKQVFIKYVRVPERVRERVERVRLPIHFGIID
jgi:ubiquinone/menaquinone biosynthesis C-methylase UbiE